MKFTATILVALLVAMAAPGADNPPKEEITRLVQSVRRAAVGAKSGAFAERPRVDQTPEGILVSISAAPGTELPVTGSQPEDPEATAKQFLKQHGRAFGITSPSVDFKLRKKNTTRDRHSIRLAQQYDGIPVFGGEMVVQINARGGVEYVSGSIDRKMDELDRKRITSTPRLSADEATAVARKYYVARSRNQVLTNAPAQLVWFAPELLKLPGATRLAWRIDVRSEYGYTVAQGIFIDAQSGEQIYELPLNHHAVDRRISDANSQFNVGTLVRTNGQPPTGIFDVDTAYDFLGDTYNFYFNHFQRDGIDEVGGPMLATVRYGTTIDAFWDGSRLFISPGEGTDDTIGHEATHGVTQYDSALIYAGEPGAMNEGISDIFGEFIDLSNSGGNDDATNRWMLFEDSQLGALRSMKDPPVFGQPDWLGSTNYFNGTFDNGGVHINSGVPNKLCYLLTDGDTFRGYTVQGLGISNVAALFYEANHNLLLATSGWDDLTRALRQAAANLGWSGAQRVNLETAMVAVGFRAAPLPNIYIDRLAVGPETGDLATPAHSMGKALELLGTATNGTFFLKGIGKTNRLARPLTILAWDGAARLEP